MPPEPIRFEYRYETRADIKRAFRAMSDTDAFNKFARAGMSFTQVPQPDGTVRIIGSVSKLGLTVRWQENPFSFRAPHWFKNRRDFENGPTSCLLARAQFASTANGGTVIDYRWEMYPKSSIFRPVLAFDLKRSLEPYLRGAIEAVVANLDQEVENEPTRSLLGPPAALKSNENARLNQLVEELAPSTLRDRLVAFIRAAPEREQYSMSPISMAQAWLAPLEDVAALFIAAAQIGLLGVRVDLLCPACLVPKAAVDEHGRLPEVHCESCGIRLDATYPEGLAVHFFPSPQIRTLHVRTECIGSPNKSPQIVAQDAVPAHTEVDFVTTLEPGTYQVRTLPQIGPAALIDVREGEQNKAVTFTLYGSIQPQLARLRPEPQAIVMKNGSDQDLFVVIERLEPPKRVLSLGRMLVEYPILREIVPATGFISSMNSFQGLAVALRAVSPEEAKQLQSAMTHARLSYLSDTVVLAIYADGERAHEDIRGVDLSRVLVGVAEGIVCESVIGSRGVPVGPAVDDAYAAMCSAGFGVIGRAGA